MHDYAETVQHLGSESMIARLGYVVPQAVERELARAKEALSSSTCEVSWALRDLVGLELWLQLFIGREQAEWSNPTHAREEA